MATSCNDSKEERNIPNNNPHPNQQRLTTHQFPALTRLTQFRLIHRHRRRLHARPDARHESSDHNMGDGERGALESCSDLYP